MVMIPFTCLLEHIILMAMMRFGLPVPVIVPNQRGERVVELAGKPAILQSRLPGKHPTNPTISQCASRRRSPMKAGQTLLLPFPAANRDPKQFDRPDEVIIDRPNNKHVAFGMGIHRCVGMHLARMELRVALEELLKRIPSFRLAGETTWSRGPIRGPRSLPLEFDV